MAFELPNLFDRTYQQIVDETIARIPVHNPEWTNFNDSDPGMTLIQLFAFMTENLLYRCNRIPERNRLKFLQLLGAPRQPGTSARGLATFSAPAGKVVTHTLSRGTDIFAGQVPFRLENGLDILPLEGRIYYKAHISEERERELSALYSKLYASFQGTGGDLAFYETTRLEPPEAGVIFPSVDPARDTIDNHLWLALLAPDKDQLPATRKKIAGKSLTLGVLPESADTGKVLSPGGSQQRGPVISFQVPRFSVTPIAGKAEYLELAANPSTDLSRRPGIVELQLPSSELDLTFWSDLDPLEQGVGNLPPSLEDDEAGERLVTWVRIRAGGGIDANPNRVNFQVSWMGVNAAEFEQKGLIRGEVLGQGSGEPDQRFRLINTSIIPESVVLNVNGEIWQAIDDLAAAGSELAAGRENPNPAKVFQLDRESGEVAFGNGVNGMRPPLGSVIQATYEYGGGARGRVGIGAINKGPSLPPGVKVGNPLPTWGGVEPETVADAERRIPSLLKRQDRLVSGEDFQILARDVPGLEVGRVEVLPLTHPDWPDIPAEGAITLIVIPKSDPLQPEAPLPGQRFLDTLSDYLEPRRLITTELHVRAPDYVPIRVALGIEVIAGEAFGPVREAVIRAVKRFLSPLEGGVDGRGWPLEKIVESAEIQAAATRVSGIARINDVLLVRGEHLPTRAIALGPFQLPHVLEVAVRAGSPPEQGTSEFCPEGADSTCRNIVPVPVLPDQA